MGRLRTFDAKCGSLGPRPDAVQRPMLNLGHSKIKIIAIFQDKKRAGSGNAGKPVWEVFPRCISVCYRSPDWPRTTAVHGSTDAPT